MRVMFIGGTGPVGLESIPRVLAAGHEAAVAHTGAHEPPELAGVEHLHGARDELLVPGGPVERWRPDVLVDTFPGGATAAKARQVGDAAARCGSGQVVAVSSVDVYRHCVDAGIDDSEPAPLARDWLPLREDAPRRSGPTPHGGDRRDNVAMEDALHGAPRLTVLRPSAIYGRYLHDHLLREWYLVGRVARGERRLPLPHGGTQLFHRVAIERVGGSVAAAVDRAPAGWWACNVADPRDLTYGGLASLVAAELGWSWEPEDERWEESDHPWNARHPVLADTTRLREVLGVADPDPHEATVRQVHWLWERREELARRPVRAG